MAIKRMQMYRKNLDTSETNLYPLTEAQYVSMENGQTVQEILSDRDSDKYTPVITNSSSTFKVGQGDNVDLSSSMKEGAYDSCVLKGKTMVNCIQEPSSKDVVLPYEFADGRYVTINDTKESGALGIELKGQTLVNLVPKMNNSGNESSLVYITEDEIKISEDSTTHRQGYWTSNEVLSKFKTNTTYTVIANITENTLTSAFMLINAYAAVGGDIASAALYVPVNFTGRFVGVFRTVSDFTNRTRLGFNAGSGNEGKLTMKNDMVILEGDWTNQELPFDSFFTGMASCKMPILHTVGKNLFDLSRMKEIGSGTGHTINLSNNSLTTNDNNAHVTGKGYIITGLKKNTPYRLTVTNDSSSEGTANFNVCSRDGSVWYEQRLYDISIGSTQSRIIYTDTGSLKVSANAHTPVGCTVTLKDIQIEEVASENVPSTSHEPYKSSILSLPEEVVLRSLSNGVCDTFNTRTGVYTQMVQEFVFDGSDDEGWMLTGSSASHETMIAFEVKNRDYMNNLNKYDNQPLLNNLFRVYTDKSWNYFDDEHFRQWGDGSSMSWVCVIPRSKLSSVTVEGFKSWLSKNPMKVVAKLKTPIITKINLSSTLKSWNTTTHIYSEIPENSLYPILSHSNPSYPVILKPSTKYSIVANSYSNNHTNSAINFNLGGATASTTVGNRVTTITTPSTLSNELLTMSGRGNKLNNVMVIEGDVVGDEPYFEGICDCKSPILSNVGKNLFDVNQTPSYVAKNTTYSIVNNEITINSTGATNYPRIIYTLDKKLLGKTIFVSYDVVKNTSNNWILQLVYTKIDGVTDYRNCRAGIPITLPNEITGDLTIGIYADNTSATGTAHTLILKNIQIEEGSATTPYEPYKSNILSCETYFDETSQSDKTIVLRSLPNGVCDTLNVETGEYVQRIGEKVFDGSNNWWQVLTYPPHDNDTHYQFKYWFGENLIGGDLWQNAQSIIANTLPSASETLHWGSQGKYGIGGDRSHFMITWEKSSSPFHDVTTLNAWLQSNPVTVQYELATPIVSTIDVQGFPYAYTSGHVQLSSGHSGQSLTPKVEYSLSANKTGQIDSNTRQVIRQQKQLDDFEAMMLTSLVQSAYDKAILQFDYEMQMMSLGGE